MVYIYHPQLPAPGPPQWVLYQSSPTEFPYHRWERFKNLPGLGDTRKPRDGQMCQPLNYLQGEGRGTRKKEEGGNVPLTRIRPCELARWPPFQPSTAEWRRLQRLVLLSRSLGPAVWCRMDHSPFALKQGVCTVGKLPYAPVRNIWFSSHAFDHYPCASNCGPFEPCSCSPSPRTGGCLVAGAARVWPLSRGVAPSPSSQTPSGGLSSGVFSSCWIVFVGFVGFVGFVVVGVDTFFFS